VLDTLQRHGYVVRMADPGDRRRVLVDITPEAQAILDRLLPEVVQATTAVLAELPESELEAFLSTLSKVSGAIASLPEDLGGPARRRTPRRLRRK
jgi:DNA-binding MarR family transcriptional regulator